MVNPGDRFIKKSDGCRFVVCSVEGDIAVCTKIFGKVYKRPVKIPVLDLDNKSLYTRGYYGA